MIFERNDYKLGWRWLLPIEKGDIVLLFGFEHDEIKFWKKNLVDYDITEDEELAAVWLINDLPPIYENCFYYPKLRSLCVVGSIKIVAQWHRWMGDRFAVVRQYGLLPASKPRIVVPLEKTEWIIQGLAIHRPGRWIARFAIDLLKVLSRVMGDRMLRRHMVCIANKNSSILPQGVRQAGLESDNMSTSNNYALYLGTADDNRKTMILPLGGALRMIVKQGESPKAKAALLNEADALQAIRNTTLYDQVPELLDVIEREGFVALHQEYRTRQRVATARLNQAALKFLSKLASLNKCVRPLSDVLIQSISMNASEAMAMGQMAFARVREHLDILAENGTMVWGNRSHGDFASWNCSWTDKGFFVFDWEKSCSWDTAFGDAFYWNLSPFVHFHRKPNIERIESRAFSMAHKILKFSSINIDDIRLYWGIWLLRRIHKNPSPLYEQFLERLSSSWK